MRYDFTKIILSLRLQYYLPFVFISGYILGYPSPKTVRADQGANSLPILQDNDPSPWPQLPVGSTGADTPGADTPGGTLTEPVNIPIDINRPATTPFTPSKPAQATDDINLVPPISVPPPIQLTSPRPPNPLPPKQVNNGNENSNPFPPASPTPMPTLGNAQEIPIGTQVGPNIQVQPITPVPLTPNPVAEPSGNTVATKPNIPTIISPYQSDEYRLTVGDTISVFAANIPEFTTENILRSDGSINLPVAGEIFVWDMTLGEAEKAITKLYVDAKVLQDPDISVRLLASSPLKIAIAGEINRPGAYDVPVLDKRLPTITDAIKIAGGIAGEADLRNVEVYRHNRLGGQELLNLNLFALFKEADLSQNITLRSGDRIVIPNAPVHPDEAKLIGAANISPDAMQVGILGEVLSPGLIQAPTQTALNQALILVGGFNSRAKKTVQLIRTNDDGSVTREKIKIDWEASVGDEKNPILQHRDVVLVGPNAIAKYSDFLDRAIGPLNRTIPFIGILDLLFPGRTGTGR